MKNVFNEGLENFEIMEYFTLKRIYLQIFRVIIKKSINKIFNS